MDRIEKLGGSRIELVKALADLIALVPESDRTILVDRVVDSILVLETTLKYTREASHES